jgi:phage tail-like protein
MDSNGLRFWMLSQLNDWLPPWRAVTPYRIGQGILDPNGNIQTALTAGTTDAAQPTWSTTPGQLTSDSGVTWINNGPTAWQSNAPKTVGQYVLDTNGNLQRVSATMGDATTGMTPPIWAVAQGDSTTDGNVTWTCMGPSQTGLFFCNKNSRLQLRSMRTDKPPVEDFTAASSMVETTPMAVDQFGTYARWDSTSGHIVAGGSGSSDNTAPEIPIYAPGTTNVTDLVLGYDGVLYVAVDGALVLIDRRNRWPNFTLNVPDFKFWRLAALPDGGVLALDRDTPQLGTVSGLPLQTSPADTPAPGILTSCVANANPPRIVSRTALPTSERFVALATLNQASGAQFVLLSWASNAADNQTAYIRTFNEGAAPSAPLQLSGVRLPYAIAWLGAQKLAAFATNLNEALIYDLEDAGETLLPAGETYILAANQATPGNNAGPFVHGFNLPPYYANGATMVPLLPLSLNSFSPAAATNPSSPAIIDSGASQTIWHRLFLEAIVPARCGAILWLTASDNPSDLTNPSMQWYPHILGAADLAAIPTSIFPDTPIAVWQSTPTEVPFAPAMLKQPPIKGSQGLFMVLIQRAQKAVRNLTGRFLGVRIQLNGDGRNAPEIAALRVYGSRFSYVQNYLPEIYREARFGRDADASGHSTRHDFFERFVGLFESQFTRIEDRIANAYLLTRPESSPQDSLDWLGSWIGIKPGNYPPQRSRARLQATPALYKQRGTIGGITQALDIATNGMCSRGAIILVEDFRLRHIFATILGADLSIQNDPLLPGYSASSNSIVGDTLFLGDYQVQAELQALFATDLNIAGSANAVQNFYDSLAHRVTVFIHNQVEKVNFKLVQRIVEAEKPAHVKASVLAATEPFMIGLASLVGVNTYLGPEPPRNTATLDVSDVGMYDVITHMPSLDPRLENGQATQGFDQPIARIKAPAAVKSGDTIFLDGSASASPPGTTITSYTWTLLQPQN